MTASARLGDVATFIRGITFKPEDKIELNAANSVACMRTKNVQAQLDLSDVWALPSTFMRREDQVLREGDVLVSSANSWNLVGKCCWIPKLEYPATFGGFVSVLRARSERLDSRYMFHWFASAEVQAIARSFGQQTTNISNLNIDRCLDLQIPLPTLDEQRRLAAILDQADALRTKRREAIAKLDTLAQLIFREMFGDPVTNYMDWSSEALSRVVVGKYGVKAGPFGSSLKKSAYTSRGYRVYGQEQVIAGNFDVGDYFIGPQKYEELKSCAVAPDDLLVSLVGSFGKVLVVPMGVAPGIINPRLLKISPDQDRVTSPFLAALLRQQSIQSELQRVAHGGTMGVLNARLLKDLQIVLPPLALQKQFARRVEGVEHLRTWYARAADAHELLSSALQHHAFNGDL